MGNARGLREGENPARGKGRLENLLPAKSRVDKVSISASKLYEIAKTLQVPVSYFFDGPADLVTDESDDVGEAANRVITDFLKTPEGLELAALFPKIGKGRVRRQTLDRVRTMADGVA